MRHLFIPRQEAKDCLKCPLTEPDNGLVAKPTVIGVITGSISLCLHLFWKFKTANSERSKWSTLLLAAWLPRQRRFS